MKFVKYFLKSLFKTPGIAFILLSANTYGQVKYDNSQTIQVLKEVSAKLNTIHAVRYKYKRESLYKGENYHNVYETTVYIDFKSGNNNDGYHFQAEDDNYFSCYNGSQYFGLQKKDKTIDIRRKPGIDLFESLSPLYNSFVSLRAILSVLITNDSVKKILTDTLIGKESFYRVQIELYNHYFGNLGGIHDFTADYIGDKHKPYELLINKKTLLPFQFTSKFGDRPDDFIAASFFDINTRPEPPEELSWFYSTYTKEYSSPKPKKPFISVGAVPENWVLPSYNPGGNDSVSLYQYSGKIVMLDFWIKTCGPCLASFPHLNELQQKIGTDKFQLLSINTEDAKEDIAFFYKKHNPVYKMLFHGESLDENYGLPAFPAIVILGKSGKIIYTATGFDLATIEKIIQDNL